MAVKLFGMIKDLKILSSGQSTKGKSDSDSCRKSAAFRKSSNQATILGNNPERVKSDNQLCKRDGCDSKPLINSYSVNALDQQAGTLSLSEPSSSLDSGIDIGGKRMKQNGGLQATESDKAMCQRAESTEEEVNLGPSEKFHVKPSDFEFLNVIGKGSFGKVMLAKHKQEGSIYAVKVLQKKMIIKRNEKKHIMCERNVLLKNLNHPFLVGLHYSFQTRDKLYFILDYVNGGELFFHLQRERCFTECRARFYAAEITSAIGYLHSQSIVYRDLKPENILLDASGHVVLTDFGLCKDGIQASETTSTFCGTPEYLAPEVLRKEAYDWAVDWWCLGAVLYEMLYGLPPFYSRDLNEMCHNILNKPVRLRTNISLAARNMLEGLLQKDKRKRLGSFGDADEVRKHEFFRTINWDDLEAKKISPPFNPNVKGAMDLKNIDPEFLHEAVPNSVCHSTSFGTSSIPENAFQGFSYVAPNML